MGVFVHFFGWYDPGSEATNLGVFDLCHFDLLKRGCANSVVGLELADGADKNRRVPFCAVKTCAVRPVFAPVVGELRAANPSKCPTAHEAKC